MPSLSRRRRRLWLLVYQSQKETAAEARRTVPSRNVRGVKTAVENSRGTWRQVAISCQCLLWILGAASGAEDIRSRWLAVIE